jgi:membrane protease YdiL (CAAX protease family)
MRGEALPPAVRAVPDLRANTVQGWVARHDTATFLVITYGISWPLWILSGALGRTPIRAPDLAWLVAQVGVFAPALAGMVVGAAAEPAGLRRAVRLVGCVYLPATALGLWIATRGFASFVAVDAGSTWAVNALSVWILVSLGARRNRLVRWPGSSADDGHTFLWSAGCLLGPSLLFLAAWGMTNLPAGRSSSTPAMPVRDLTALGVVAAFTMNLAYGGSLGEEPGWRGAWLPRLLRHHSPLGASVIIGFWWALWHAPIDLSQGFALGGMGALIIRQVWTLPLTIIFTWVMVRAGGSLLPPLVLHTAINAIPDFALSQPARYENALVVFGIFLGALAIVATRVDPRLRKVPPEAQG